MKMLLAIASFLMGVVTANADVVFQGYMTASNRPYFIISVGKEKTSGWLAVGAKFEGISLLAFDPKAELLTVEKDGKQEILHIVDGRSQTASDGGSRPPTKPIVVSIGTDENISVGDDTAMLDALTKKFELVAAMEPRPKITLRPPGNASIDSLRLIMDLCRKAGITRFDISSQ